MWTETYGKMFQHGLDVQDQHLAKLEEIFNSVNKPKA